MESNTRWREFMIAIGFFAVVYLFVGVALSIRFENPDPKFVIFWLAYVLWDLFYNERY